MRPARRRRHHAGREDYGCRSDPATRNSPNLVTGAEKQNARREVDFRGGSIAMNRSVPILKTKLRPAFVSSRLLPRERLLQLLPAAPEVRLILLHAVAGAGKSSLLFECVERGLLQGAWYSLSDEDRDPHVFHSYVLTTLDEKYPGLARSAWKVLEQPGEANWEALSTTLINSMMDFGRPVTLVLDDYQVVQSVEIIAAAISKLVRHGPLNFTLVLSTRERPALPLTRLQAKGRLLELSPQDLLFREQEIVDFFRQVWSIELDGELAALLLKKTEGWVTGLQLTAQAMGSRSQESARAYIEALHGQDDVVYQYIASEVFETQPAEVQNFLLATSVVDSFTPELGRLLSGHETPLAMLAYVDQARLFLVHLDSRGEWFRYHHLFREFLQRRLQESHVLDCGELHRIAAEWHLEKDNVVSGISHFLKSSRLDRAADLLEREGGKMLMGGLHATFRAQMACLPTHLLEARPGLWLHSADLLELDGDWPRAIEGYQRCLEAYRAAGAENEAANVLEKLSLTYVKYGATDQLLQVCEEGLQHCQEEGLRSLLSAWLGVALVTSGLDWQRGYTLISHSHQLAYRCGNPRSISWACLTYGFGYHMPRGNFTQATQVLREGIAFFRQVGWPAVIMHLSIDLALTDIVSGQLDAAEEVVEGALQSARDNGIAFVLKGLENVKAMVLLEKRNFPEAEQCLRVVQKTDVPVQIKPWFFRNQALLLHFLGYPEQSRVACQEMLKALELTGYGMYAPECLFSLAFMLWHEGQVEQALGHAQRGLDIAREAQAKFWQMKAYQLLALFSGKSGEASEHLKEAIEFTEANGYHAYWLSDSWKISGPLLEQALAQDLLRADSPLNKFFAHQPASPKARPFALEIRALGPLEITRSGQTLIPGPYIRPRVLLLLKYFLTFPNRLLAAEQLMDEFWPDLKPAQARRALNSHLTLVRRAVRLEASEPALIVREGDGYRLSGDPQLWYDSRQFREQWETARMLSRESQVPAAVEFYLQVEKLYRGDFLCDDRYDDFIVLERQRLRKQYEQTLEYLADFYSMRGFAEEAIERYRRALQGEDPSEEILQKLLYCCVAHGDTETATREFELFKSRTEDADGLRLDRSTGAVYRKLLKKSPP